MSSSCRAPGQRGLHKLMPPVHVRLANQEVLRWQLSMLNEVGADVTHDQIKEYLWKTLKSGQVVPGYAIARFHLPMLTLIVVPTDTATVSCVNQIQGLSPFRSSARLDQTSALAPLSSSSKKYRLSTCLLSEVAYSSSLDLRSCPRCPAPARQSTYDLALFLPRN